MVTVIGIDAHSQVHSATAVDTHGRPIGQLGVGADAAQLGRLLGWITSFEGERLIAVEGAKGFGLALTRLLLQAGEQVIDVATHLTAESRKRSRRRGKDDQIDAVAIARVALREPDLPRMDQAHLDADLKLLVDARDQLVAEQCRVRNRLHALLGAIAPGYREHTGALITVPALARARSLTLTARSLDAVRAKLALAAIRRLRALDQEIADLERDITAQVRRRNPTHLLAIPGVGMLVAGKILGETRDIRHFPSVAAFAAYAGAAPVPASSGNTTRHRLARGGNRQLNRALFTIAMVQARWHPKPRPTWPANAPRARPRPRHAAVSSATWPPRSTTQCCATSHRPTRPLHPRRLDDSGAPTVTRSFGWSARCWPSSTTNGSSPAATSPKNPSSSSWSTSPPPRRPPSPPQP